MPSALAVHEDGWRGTERALDGKRAEPMDLASLGGQAPVAPEPRNWNASSFELLHGTEITEFSQDTMPSAFYADVPEPPPAAHPKKKPS